MSSKEIIWYDDITKFITNDNFYKVIPEHYYTFEEKLNAITRLCLYSGLIVPLIFADYRYLFIGIIAAIITIAIYKYHKDQEKKEETYRDSQGIQIEDNGPCAKPTVNNPFMNILVSDYGDNPDRSKACNITNPANQSQVNDKFHARMFRDVNDIYDNSASQRQYYTAAVTTIPNDQTAFAEWCFGKGASCKQGNGTQCLNNIYTELNR